jgi:hypothetical protein
MMNAALIVFSVVRTPELQPILLEKPLELALVLVRFAPFFRFQ